VPAVRCTRVSAARPAGEHTASRRVRYDCMTLRFPIKPDAGEPLLHWLGYKLWYACVRDVGAVRLSTRPRRGPRSPRCAVRPGGARRIRPCSRFHGARSDRGSRRGAGSWSCGSTPPLHLVRWNLRWNLRRVPVRLGGDAWARGVRGRARRRSPRSPGPGAEMHRRDGMPIPAGRGERGARRQAGRGSPRGTVWRPGDGF